MHNSSVEMFAALGNYWRYIGRQIEKEMETGDIAISAKEFIILHALSLSKEMTMNLSDAVAILGLPRTTVAGYVTHLEQLGFASKGRKKENQQIVTISLTAMGEDFLGEWLPSFSDVVSQVMFKDLDYTETHRAMVTYQNNRIKKPALGANAYLTLPD